MVDGKGRTVAEIAIDNYPPDSVLGAKAREWFEENQTETSESEENPENEDAGPRA
jgi:hypothetical protein